MPRFWTTKGALARDLAAERQRAAKAETQRRQLLAELTEVRADLERSRRYAAGQAQLVDTFKAEADRVRAERDALLATERPHWACRDLATCAALTADAEHWRHHTCVVTGTTSSVLPVSLEEATDA